MRNLLAGATLAFTALLTTGCESLLFAFANRSLGPPDATVVYAPEQDLSLDVYRPKAQMQGPAPTVVFFYGGGWQRGEREQYQFVGHRLADNGVLAIIADYRTFPEATFPGFVKDAARAVAWSREHAVEYGGAPGSVFVAGHSAGAQIAALLGTDARYLHAQGLQPTDLAGVIGLSGPYDFVINGQYRKVFGDPEQWTQAQAINFVDGNEPPFLLIHGADDQVVEARDSIELAEKLRRNEVPVDLLILPDAGHSAPLLGLYDVDRQPLVLPAMLAFIRKHAGRPVSKSAP